MSEWRFSFILVLVLLCFCEANYANQTCHILPSSCGNIKNISFPFRLKTDPEHCGYPGYELGCENNQTVLYLNSKEYYVLSIDYSNYTIRILDPGFRKNHCPAFPLHSLSYDDFPTTYSDRALGTENYEYRSILTNTPVMFITCPNKVESSRYVDTSSCNTTDKSTDTFSYSYVLVGADAIRAGVEDSCMISDVAWCSSDFSNTNITSFSSILDTMADGFSFLWYRVYCGKCDLRTTSCLVENNSVVCTTPLLPPPGIPVSDQIYNRLWYIWSVLPNFWWGELSKEQEFRDRYYPGGSHKGLQDFWWGTSTRI